MPKKSVKRIRRRNFQTLHRYKRARRHNANVTQNTSAQANQRVKLALIAEVKKYPILCTSLDVDVDSETCFGAWEKIAKALQIDESTSQSPMDCIKMWKNIKRSFVSYIKDDIHTRGAVIRAMQCLFPDFNEENLLVEAVEDLDENDSSGVGSDTAEEIMRQKTNHTAVRKTLREPPDELKLELIAEVKKYPILCTSLDVDEDSETCYGAWEKIAEALQIDNSISTSPVDYCRKTWKIIKINLSWYIMGDRGETEYITAMLKLFPECYEKFGRRRRPHKYFDDSKGQIDEEMSGSTSETDYGSDETYPDDLPSKKRTAAPPTEDPMCEGEDENNELNNSSEVGSATAESAEELIPPTTNDAAVPAPQQAATPGNQRSIGAGSTERAVSLAIVDHLFDSLHSPAAKTDVCNSLMQLLYKYRPNVSSDVIEYGARQPDLFNIAWSRLPIPEDICREIWRRDMEEKLRNVYKISSSKRRAKKEN